MVTKTNELGMQKTQWDIIGSKTPQHQVFTRPGRGGKAFTYVKTGYVVETLNNLFNGMWDFEIIEHEIGKTQIWVKGKLTGKIMTPSGVETISKTQYGGAEIKTRDGQAIDIADDLKAASSDALKKCASLLGIAADLYGGEDMHQTPEKHAPESDTEDLGEEPHIAEDLCLKHNVHMKERHGPNGTFYSHARQDKTGQWEYCSGAGYPEER